MKRYFLTVFGVLILGFALHLKAQVTIGSTFIPKEGSLLDLKQKEGLGENSNKGLMLPRVNLTNAQELYPMFIDSQTYNTSETEKAKEKLQHAGLWVYNVNQCFQGSGKDKGVFIWSGNSWVKLSGSKPKKSPNVLTNNDQEGTHFYSLKFDKAGEWMLSNLSATIYDTKSPLAGQRLPDAGVMGTGALDKSMWGYPNKIGQPITSDSQYKIQPHLGKLYNFFAAAGSSTQLAEGQEEGGANALVAGKQGICPDGWHLPSDIEWNKLLKELDENSSKYANVSNKNLWTNNSSTILGEQAKIADALLAMCKPIDFAMLSNGKSFTDAEGGFNAYLAGTANIDGATFDYGKSTAFWTASVKSMRNSSIIAINRKFIDEDHSVMRVEMDAKQALLSVRCKRDEYIEFKKCGDPIMDQDGNIYTSSLFGDKCWTTQNLRTKADLNTNEIEDPGTPHLEEHGLLYTWKAATGNLQNQVDVASEYLTEKMYGSDQATHIQGICPTGWHIPSDWEWAQLEKVIASKPSEFSTSTDAGRTLDDNTLFTFGMRPITGKGWNEYLVLPDSFQPTKQGGGKSKSNTNNGFAIYLTGAQNDLTTTTAPFGKASLFWTSSIELPRVGMNESARSRGFGLNQDKVLKGRADKQVKMSVRCVLD